MTGESVARCKWCDKCKGYHPPESWCPGKPPDCVFVGTAVQYPKLSQERICDMATSRYGSLTGLLCGQAAQTVEPIPIRAYAGEPTRPRPGELSLWVDANMRAWAGYGDVKTLVSAPEIIELIALADGAGCG